MATITITKLKHIDMAEGPHSLFPGETLTALNKTICYFDQDGLAVGSGDTVSVDLGTFVQNKLRNGKTVTIRSAAMVQAAYDIINNRALGYKTVVLTGNILTFVPTTSDFSTTAAIAISDRLERPFAAVVAYSES